MTKMPQKPAPTKKPTSPQQANKMAQALRRKGNMKNGC